MSNAVDLSSMIGTWVGAGIGIIALVGIVGPVLVFLASRTKRNKTLNSMGRQTNGYISPGWHLGPNIYLGQRIRAPDLRQSGTNGRFEGNYSLNAASLQAINTDAHWVHFGALLEGYGMKFAKGGDVLIKDGKTYLPTHPSWVLAVGILGRYSTRRVWQGRPSRRTFTHGVNFFRDSKGPVTRNRELSRPWGTHLPARPEIVRVRVRERSVHDYLELADTATGETSRRKGPSILHGTTGSLSIHSHEEQTTIPHPLVTYRAAPTTAYADEMRCDPNTLPIEELFLPSIGLLKVRDGLYVSLADSQSVEAWRDEYEDNSRHSDDESSEESSISISRDDRRRDTRPTYDSRQVPSHIRRKAHAYRLGSFDILKPLVEMGSTFVDLNVGFDCMGMIPENKRDVMAQLKDVVGSTYVPADHTWVRIMDETYIARVDAQRVALALLKLSWSPQKYLIGGDELGVAMSIFKAASGQLHPMMVRLQDKVSLLDLTAQDKQKLSNAMGPVLRRLERYHDSHDIQTFRKLYELDSILLDQGSPESQVIVDEVVAILSITNKEFRDIVHQSIRNLKESDTALIDLDLRSMTLKVPSAFGVRQHFQVDWDAISDTASGTRPHETVPVKHTAIVLASIRSLVLCMMLLTCSDAGPLLELVGECGDLAYMD